MRNVHDSVPGVAYRTGSKGCMDSLNMLEWLRETRVIKPFPQQKLRHLCIDICSGHNLTEEILSATENIPTTLVYFPPNTTELVQPCDALVIQNIKSAWQKR